MGTKLLWTGLSFILALNPVLTLIGLQGSQVITIVGAVLMIIGCILLWMGK